MFKKVLYVFTALSLVAVGSTVLAQPTRQNATLLTRGTTRTLILPEATSNASVISLGNAIDPETGNIVEGFAIIHRSKGNAKPDNPGNGNGKGGGKDPVNSCYGFLAKGAKWRSVEPWVMNTENIDNLDGTFVFGNINTDIVKWEDAAVADILGSGSVVTDTLLADTNSPDGVNEVYFADISNSGAIGVTIVWGIFSGPPSGRELVEWDMIFDDVDFDWSQTGEAGKMDFENIATHELGHAVGLGDIYEDACGEETMYGYAANGETKKGTLESGDITGINKLY